MTGHWWYTEGPFVKHALYILSPQDSGCMNRIPTTLGLLIKNNIKSHIMNIQYFAMSSLNSLFMLQ